VLFGPVLTLQDNIHAFQPPHLSWLRDTDERQTTSCGREIEIWALTPEDDEAVLSAWARHFRQHYVSDEELPAMVDGTGLRNAEYLRKILFPDASRTPGPSLRSGDFGEILVADYVEYILGYWCPRTLRYQESMESQRLYEGLRHHRIQVCDQCAPSSR
jgi:hypothetical protein